ncbi:hypothetical protein GBF35_27925 [Nonomuraea phyllanthi]|uniref:hypothetical protein n=1 Tax=Nonomuraea phyllanthi TaxID=2219224 RepID=UPI0012936B72|nr:hypothetical protein [Nonomuraea phyllanthi]QFY09959.1 hypothetical protein GBF35_27925 [Nonomuraea phyllanthi]
MVIMSHTHETVAAYGTPARSRENAPEGAPPVPRRGEGSEGALLTAGRLTSVGQIAGLRPRHRRGDGGHVPAADVDLIDALDPRTWRTVASWLLDRPSTAVRRTRLQTLASFLRWLLDTEPDRELFEATGLHLARYCEHARTGALAIGGRTPGKELARSTTARKHAVLSSFYAFAWQCGALAHHFTAGPEARTLRRDERRLLRLGTARLADRGHLTQAVAAALLEATGATVEVLATLSSRNITIAGEKGASVPLLITMRDRHGDIVAFPIPAQVRPWLTTLLSTHRAGDLLFTRGNGQRVDRQWVRLALVDAALAGGIPKPRAELLRPHML